MVARFEIDAIFTDATFLFKMKPFLACPNPAGICCLN